MKKIVILTPIITEKSMILAKSATYSFKVLTSANSNEISQAVTTMYKVKVADVRTVNVIGKTKRFGKKTGKRANWKKAYVSLEKGQKIKEFEIEEEKPDKKAKDDKKDDKKTAIKK